uniref:Secreted protein n=1 Tax=Angiostrongylus cantonensis TaxID=6313 RepID=A0A0K0DEC1_ANGCA
MYWLRYLKSLFVVCDVVTAMLTSELNHRRHGRTTQLHNVATNRNIVGYIPDHRHPELRTAIRSVDDDKTEFVRREWTETVYKRIRTYSEQ